MRTLFLPAFSFFVAVLFCCSLDAQDKYAILVGVESYNEEHLSQLKFTENDALGLAKALGEVGFNTKVMTGQSRTSTLKPNSPEKILTIISTQLNSCAEGDTIIVSLSGHGLQFGEETPMADGTRETYFCPEDANPYDKETLLPISKVIELLKQCEASRKLLLIDACRNEFVKSEAQRKSGKRLNLGSVHETNQTIPGGMTVLFSCGQSQFSWEHEDLEHSVFTYFVMQYLSGKAEQQYYDDDKLHLDGLTAFVRKKTNSYVFENNLSADGQAPVASGSSSDWILGQGIDPVRALLTKHVEFLGGEKQLRQVKTYEMSGRMTGYATDGTAIPGTFNYLNHEQTILQTLSYPGYGSETAASTPKFGWVSDVQGKRRYQTIDEHWVARLLTRYPLSAIEMLQRSGEFRLGKKVDIGGTITTELSISDDSKTNVIKWYFAEDGRLVSVITPMINLEGTAQLRMEDFRKEQGVAVPWKINVYHEGRLIALSEFSKVRINPDLDPNLFRVPTDLASGNQAGRTKDELERLLDQYNSNRGFFVEQWNGFVSDIRFRRTGQSGIQVDYTLASGILETLPAGYLNSAKFKSEFIENNISEEEENWIKLGIVAKIVFKNSAGNIAAQFEIDSADID